MKEIKEYTNLVIFFVLFFFLIGFIFFSIYFLFTRNKIKIYRQKQLKLYREKYKKPNVKYHQTGLYLPIWELLKWYFPLFISLVFIFLGIYFCYIFYII